MSWDNKGSMIFSSIVCDVLRTMVPGLEYRDGESFDECQELWEMTFKAYSPDYQEQEPKEAGEKFKEFVQSLIPADVRKTVKCTVEIGRSYGAEMVRFGLDDLSERRKSAIQGTYSNLIKIVMSEHDDYAARHLPKSPATNGHGNGNGNGHSQGVVTKNTFIADRLSVSVDDGKTTYKLHGEQWTKYGVKVWPEVLNRAGISTKALTLEGLEFPDGLNCTVLLKPNGQPDKVASISKA